MGLSRLWGRSSGAMAQVSVARISGEAKTGMAHGLGIIFFRKRRFASRIVVSGWEIV